MLARDRLRPRWARIALLLVVLAFLLGGVPGGATASLPSGFVDSVAWSGLTAPTAVRFAPDGRIFVAEKSGLIKVFDSLADPSPTVYADLRTQVDDFADRGLLGLGVDPKFTQGRPFVYALYSYDKNPLTGFSPAWNDDCPSPPGADGDGCVAMRRLTRIDPLGSETVLVEGWCDQYSTHSVGSIDFGPDGSLYASSGDGASYTAADYGQGGDPVNPCGDPPAGAGGTLTPPTSEGGALRAQSFRRAAGQPVSLDGSILRLDPDTGAAMADNPAAGDPNVNRRRIVAYGMRNPFRFTFRPGTGELWFGDVGWNEWEEINRIPDIASARNYGWPCYEGAARMGAYDSLNLNSCETLYTAGSATAPYWTYNHGSTLNGDQGCPVGTSSISGIAFYTGSQFPAQYRNALFMADYARRCLMVMLPGGNGLPDPTTARVFESAASGPVDLQQGPDGALYYVDIEGGAIHKVAFPSGNHTPTASATATPDHGPTPLTVAFDGSSSSDPDGTSLTFSWDLNGDGTFGDSTAQKPSFTYTTPGNYKAQLRVTDPGGASDTFTVPITAGEPPIPTITSPTASLSWAVGDPIGFSGSAVDAQGATIPASGLSWRLDIRHCARTDPTNCHTHFGSPVAGVASGTLTAPNHDYPSKLQLVLTATDARGLSGTTSVTLDPKTADLTLASSPSGAELTIGADTGTAPFTQRFIQNATTDVTAPSAQTFAGLPYVFSNWSDGGALTHTITVPRTNTTYLCTLSQVTETTLAGADVVGSSTSQAAPGRAEVYRTSASVTGTANKLRLYLDPASTATSLELGLYADNNGQPGALLGRATTSTVAAGTWNEVVLGTPISVVAGTAYWIGLLNPATGTGTLRWRDHAGGTGGAEQTSPTGPLDALPAAWTTGGRYTDGPVSGYAFGAPSGVPATPAVGASPTSLAISAVAGGGNPAARTLGITNTGGGTLNFTISDDAPWLSVTPTSGTAPQNLSVSVDTTGLAAGTYNGTISITAPGAVGSPTSVPVTLTVSAAATPVLAVAPASLTFSSVAGSSSPAPASLAISNAGGGSLGYTAVDDAAWLSVAPGTGTAPSTVTATVNTSGLMAGIYTANITITAAGASGSPKTVPVTLTVSPASSGTLAGADVIGTSVSTAPPGAGEVYRITAATTGSASRLRLYVDATSTATRLQLGLYTDAAGTPTSLLAAANTASVTRGAWNEVTLTTPVPLTAGANYWLALLNPSTGTGTLAWRDRAGGSGGPERTSTSRTLADLPATWSTQRNYTDGPVSGYALGAPAPPPSPVLTTAPTSLAFSATAGSANPASRTVTVSNTGGGTLNFTATDDASWLSESPTSGTAPQSVTASVDTAGLAAGTYTANLTINAGAAGTSIIPVTLTLTAPTPPTLAVAPGSINFSGQAGAANPASQSLSVTNTGGGSLTYTVSDDAAWLSESPAGGGAPGTVTLSADTTGLAAGTYTAIVTVNAGAAGSKTVPVALTLTNPPPPVLTVTPTSLSFGATQGGAAPPSQPVSVTNTGGGTLPFTVSDDATWLSASPSSGSANTSVSVTADPAGLAPGTYTGTVTVNGGAAGSRSVTVTLSVSAPADGLVGAWGFEESTGTTAADASGKGNSGTINGPLHTAAGKYGSALIFDGINDWVTVADAAALHLSTGMTLEGWVNPTAGAAGGAWRALAVKETATGLAWALYPFGDGGFPSGHARTSSEQWARGTGALPLNTWSHVAVTYDGATIRTYVNGVQVGTKAQTGALVSSTQPLRFGGDAVWPEWFQGTLDEIRVYDRALTAAEIGADMTRPVTTQSFLSPARVGGVAPARRATSRQRHRRNPGAVIRRYRSTRPHAAPAQRPRCGRSCARRRART